MCSSLGVEIRRKKNIPSSGDWFAGFDYMTEGREAVKCVQANSMLAPVNLLTLFEQAVYCEKQNIPGAFVECGVWKGGAVGVMALANLRFGAKRRPLHLFDAFDDICAPDAETDGQKAVADMGHFAGVTDKHRMQGQLTPIKGFYDDFGGHGTVAACRELLEKRIMYPSEYIHYHSGWFQETIARDADQIGEIAVLRLDGDWYESIKICLEHLYDKVGAGGVVVIDDYGYYEGCTKAVDEFLERKKVKTFLSYSTVGCRYFVKPPDS